MLRISEVFLVPSKSVVGVPSSCESVGPASAMHGTKYVTNSLLRVDRTLCLQRYEQIIGCRWGVGSCSQASVQLVLYARWRVQIWGKRGPGQGVNVIGGQECCGQSFCVGPSVFPAGLRPWGWPSGAGREVTQCLERTDQLSLGFELAPGSVVNAPKT
jgi:hypothetical protein